MSAYTPGPWRVTEVNATYLEARISAKGRDPVAVCHSPKLDRLKANANLIAQAPAMAEELRATCDLLYADHAEPGTPEGRRALAAVNRIRSILATIEGKSQ